MRVVNPATGSVISVDYADATVARRAAQAMADDMGVNLELHPSGPDSEGSIEPIEAEPL